MPATPTRNVLALIAALMLFLAACGDDGGTPLDAGGGAGDSESGESEAETPPDGSEDGSDAESEPDEGSGDGSVEDMVDEMVDDLEGQQAAEGGGSATLTVGDQEWTFTSVLCAFGEEEIGQEGAEFVLSSLQDGMQMYASIDSFGESLSLNDIEDFENPSVSLDSFGSASITVDGKNITGEGDFMDGTSESFDTIPGTFTATCP